PHRCDEVHKLLALLLIGARRALREAQEVGRLARIAEKRLPDQALVHLLRSLKGFAFHDVAEHHLELILAAVALEAGLQYLQWAARCRDRDNADILQLRVTAEGAVMRVVEGPARVARRHEEPQVRAVRAVVFAIDDPAGIKLILNELSQLVHERAGLRLPGDSVGGELHWDLARGDRRLRLRR